MNVGLQRSAQALRAHQRSLDTISANLANLGTTGYKRVRTTEHVFEVPVAAGRKARGVATANHVDFGQGNLNRTGRDLDLALFGEGFFAVEGARGEVYTRDGSFHVTPEGVLVTGDGLPVAWESNTGTLDPTGLPITVDGEGAVRQGPDDVGRLRIVNFAEPSRLVKGGDGNWHAPRGLAAAAHTATVHQGALEESNATGMEELVAMISVQRSFDAVARVMNKIEESYSRLTRPF